MSRRFLIPSAPGLQDLLAEELKELGLKPQIEASRACVLEGEWDTAARVLTHSRIAARVLVSVKQFSAKNQAMLYHQVRRIPWPDLIPHHMTIAVFAQGTTDGTDFKRSFAPLKIKDAIVDEYRKWGDARPNVDRNNPDVEINAHFYGGRCEISVDLSGIPLHRRGYRAKGGEAPLRENRAAALLRLAGYDGSRPLRDPFCGSGTIPIEAALVARNIAPGLLRPIEEFTLHRLIQKSHPALEAARKEAKAQIKESTSSPIVGSDIDPRAIQVAKQNADRAGLSPEDIRFEVREALDLPPGPVQIVANPPYGERIGEQEQAAKQLGDFVHQLKHHNPGSTLTLVVPKGPVEHAVGMKPARRFSVESGDFHLRFMHCEIFAGKARER